MPSLKEIADDIRTILEAIESPEEHEESPDTLYAILASRFDDLRDKVDRYVYLIRQNEAQIDYLRREKHDIEKKIERLIRLNERLLNWAQYIMEQNGWVELDGEVHKLKLVNTRGRVEILEPGAIPDEYLRKKVEISRSAILRALREGKEVPGAVLVKERKIQIK